MESVWLHVRSSTTPRRLSTSRCASPLLPRRTGCALRTSSEINTNQKTLRRWISSNLPEARQRKREGGREIARWWQIRAGGMRERDRRTKNERKKKSVCAIEMGTQACSLLPFYILHKWLKWCVRAVFSIRWNRSALQCCCCCAYSGANRGRSRAILYTCILSHGEKKCKHLSQIFFGKKTSAMRGGCGCESDL